MKPQELTIDSEVFEELRDELSAAINQVIDQLISKRMKKGTVGAKIGITIQEHFDADTGEVTYMPVFEPGISMKMGMQDGGKLSKRCGLFLRKSPCGTNFIADNQISMDELMDDQKGA